MAWHVEKLEKNRTNEKLEKRKKSIRKVQPQQGISRFLVLGFHFPVLFEVVGVRGGAGQ